MELADFFILHHRFIWQSDKSYFGAARTPAGGRPFWEENMKKLAFAALAAALMGGVAHADTIKVGVIGPFSDPFALQGKNFKAGIDAYMALNGNTVGDDTVENIYRDFPTADPQQSKPPPQK